MSSHERYEILETIGRGDFATVSSARDHELGREVAIKQIHPQFLADPQQLERYWQEAQLLASLEHPHIMTIYDVVRERGWLILERMQGNLAEMLDGNPVDLKDLRLTLNYTLHALQFMHENGIVHGDIKPANLMVDRNHRVKLGDFGIARRLQGDDGSVVKGTTKYIAPEVVSDQFGTVGPHSDLYSLGFTAYELMCGEYFKELFPGLNLYGRDQQIVWMMWHSTADQQLPEIGRVLEGVPADLTHVIHKLTQKNPTQRYQSAKAVLADLSTDGEAPPAEPSPEALEAVEQAATKAQRKRFLTIAVLACSVVLSIGVALFPSGKKPAPPAPAPIVRPTEGQVVQIDLPNQRFFLLPADGSSPQSIPVNAEMDRVFVNDERATLEDLVEGDMVSISYLKRDDDEFAEFFVSRELSVRLAGVLVQVYPRTKSLRVIPAGDTSPMDLVLSEAATIRLNGANTNEGRKFELAHLKPQDRVKVQHIGDGDQWKATAIEALRTISVRGFLVTASGNELTLRIGQQWDAPDARELQLALGSDCPITLNGDTTENGRPLALHDLREKDSVSIQYDATVNRIEAFRDVMEFGTLTTINYGKQTFEIDTADGTTATFRTDTRCRIEIDGEESTVDFYFLRPGDRLTVQRRSPDPAVRDAVLISVEPQPDNRAWALVIGHDDYDNPRLPKSAFAGADALSMHLALRVHYRVPTAQLLVEHNATRVKLENSIPQFLDRVKPGSQLIVYFVGHGYIDPNRQGYLAPQGFDERRVESSALSLRWLLEQMESCGAAEKVLMLDTTHQSVDRLPDRYSSPHELAEAVKPGPTRPVSVSVTVIASCETGQNGLPNAAATQGMFGAAAAAAYQGKADSNQDHRIDVGELYRFLETRLAAESTASARQTPHLFVPDATPPRMTTEAKDAIAMTLGYLRGRYDPRVEQQADTAQLLAPDQPEPGLALGLVQLKHDRTLGATRTFDQVRSQFPDSLIAYHALAWQSFRRSESRDGVELLEQLVLRIPETRNAIEQAYAEHVLEFAGRLTSFAMNATPADKRLARADIEGLNNAVRQRDAALVECYTQGYKHVFSAWRNLQERLASTTNVEEKAPMQRDLSRLTYYVDGFDFGIAQQLLRAGLDD
ncbi:MAG TPA: serine/threonine-protein kinase [Pirellulaceae bacterium]|nr:serine/threonine-protein kinase [Pirellulaceae bacterium]